MSTLSRRQALKLMGLTVAGGVLAACTPATTSPTNAPVSPTDTSAAPAATSVPIATAMPTATTVALQDTPTGSTGKPITLTFWNGFTGPDQSVVKAMVDKFNQENPGTQIDMQIIAWDSLYTKLLPALSAGQGPDIMGIGWNNIHDYAKSGVLLPLDSYIDGSNGLDRNNFPGTVKGTVVGGKTYGVPMQYFDFAMYYNKDIFTEAGITNPPTTWEEMEADAIACTKVNSTGQVVHYGLDLNLTAGIPVWYAWIWQAGGDVVSADNTQALINAPEAVSAGDLLERLFIKDKVTPVGITGPDSDTLFQSGKSAMHVTGPWMIAGFDQAGLNYGIAPLPKGKVAADIADGPCLAINASTKVPDAAWTFLAYWNSTESVKYFALNDPAPPANLALMNDPDIQANAKLAAFAAGLPYSRLEFPDAPNRTDIDTAVGQAVQQIAYGKLSVQDAFDQAAVAINAALKG